MRVAISASTGLIGKALVDALVQRGDTVLCLVRKPTAKPNELFWDPAERRIDAAALEGVDAVIHLSGEPIASGRWTAEKKRAIIESREGSTRFLCETLAQLTRKPEAFLCASAVGFYGDRGDEVLDEQSLPGANFLSDVCRRWEAACDPAREAGLRVAMLRLSTVLSMRGGALPKMLTPFRLCLGGPLGNGHQYMSWITLADLVAAFLFVLNHRDVSGPVNATAPHPVTNAAFTQALAHELHRPAFLPAPAFALRLALGQMADELLLASTRAVPRRLEEAGFVFRASGITLALHELLGQPKA